MYIVVIKRIQAGVVPQNLFFFPTSLEIHSFLLCFKAAHSIMQSMGSCSEKVYHLLDYISVRVSKFYFTIYKTVKELYNAYGNKDDKK